LTAGSLLVALGLFVTKTNYWGIVIFLTIAASAALFAHSNNLPTENLHSFLKNIERLRGVVSSYPTEHQDRTSFLVTSKLLPGKIQVHYHHPGRDGIKIEYGDELELTQQPEIQTSFEDFDYQKYLLSRDTWAVTQIWSAQKITVIRRNQGESLLQWGFTMRQQLFAKIDQILNQPVAALLKGLLFGDRSELGPEIESSFRDAGVMHVLAVSGLHLGILIGLFWSLLRAFRFSFTKIYLTLIPLVVLYLTIVGFKTSLVRASIMFAFVALGWVIAERGWILRRWVDPMQGLAAAALVILLITPMALYDVSFQMSFAATAGILLALQLFLPILDEWQLRWENLKIIKHSRLTRQATRFAKGITIFFVVSLSAQIAVAPIIGFQFERVYLATLLANFAIVPLATLAIWLSIPLLVTSFYWPMASEILSLIENEVLFAMIAASTFFANLPGNYLILDDQIRWTALALVPVLLSAPAFWQIQILLQRQIPTYPKSL
jgi:competence protein ComEC